MKRNLTTASRHQKQLTTKPEPGTDTRKEFYYKAFKKMFYKSLGINLSSQVTIVYDESFFQYFKSLSDVINDLHLSATYVYIPIDYQHIIQEDSRFISENEEVLLPTGLSAALSNSDIVLNFLNGDIRSSKIRGAIIDKKKNENCQLIHCPGISDDILKLVLASPYKRILRESETLAWALGTAKSCTLKTTDPNGNDYYLTMNLEGWDNEPIMSSGTINKGSWGNIPPGETFCCPNPNFIEGKICINGSVPGNFLNRNQYFILSFARGQLIQWEKSSDFEASSFFDNLKNESEKIGDKNWNTIAELGIGLNPEIKHLIGNSLFDEKMEGTIHIALGDNVVFGHDINSHIHADLVTLKPTLILDDHVVIDCGKLNIGVVNSWRKKISYPQVDIEKHDVVSIKAAKIRMNNFTVERKLHKKDRVGYVMIISSKHKGMLQRLQDILEYDNVILFRDLVNKVGRSNKKSLIQIIEKLFFYRVIDIQKTNKKEKYEK